MGTTLETTQTSVAIERTRPPPNHLLRVVSTAAGRSGPTLVLGRRPIVIGRGPGDGGLKLTDLEASRRHAAIRYDVASGRYVIDDLQSSNGTLVDGTPITSAPLSDHAVIQIGRTFLVHVITTLDERALPDLPTDRAPAHHATLQRADLVAASPLPIIIRGPTGAGKERLAQRVHRKSGRQGPLRALNCATLNDDLLGSELFGHVRGAFSGAETDRKGLFQSASGGTVFLDEIAELPIAQQPALLRVLQEKRVRPVGSDREVAIDVRLVAATHADLEAACVAGRFRRDLLARLRGVVLRLPPLAERRDEICPLFRQFLPGRLLSSTVAARLLNWDWPENVRELQHVAAYVEAVAPGETTVELDHLPDRMRSDAVEAEAPHRDRPPTADELIAVLRTHKGVVSRVADAFGVARPQVYRWRDRYGLNFEDYR